MRIPLCFILLLLAGPCMAAVSRRQAVSATSSSVGISDTLSGELLVVFAYSTSSNTPVKPDASWTSIDTFQSGSNAFLAAYKISTGGENTTGVWANASAVVCHGYIGAQAIGTGFKRTNATSGSTLTYGALTTQAPDASSW